MIRPMQITDTPDLLALLLWMDVALEREVFAPDARDLSELQLECEGSQAWVDVDDDGMRAYAALSPFRDGLVLEGPLGEDGPLLRLTQQAVQQADGQPVYAFCSQENQAVRDALEGAGFSPMHSTAFYSAPLNQLAAKATLPAGLDLSHRLPIQEYKSLYKAAEDAWADRLDWSPEQYDAHFRQGDVRLVALTRGGHGVGFAELEFNPEAARADLTYLAVHPAERREGYGRHLLALAAAEAARHPEIRTLRVRAHDHMHSARTLYAQAGFTHARSIVTYLREGDEEV